MKISSFMEAEIFGDDMTTICEWGNVEPAREIVGEKYLKTLAGVD